MKNQDLQDFFVAASREVSEEYFRIQRRASEDPGTAGDQGEENWAAILRRWLPGHFHIVTKGRILGANGLAGPQMDVLVLSPSYPHGLLEKKLYLAAGVAAAFECKLTLRAEDIVKVYQNSSRIRGTLAKRAGTPYKELYSGMVYGLLAHAHVWRRKPEEVVSDISQKLLDADLEHCQHPRDLLDLICVSNLATWHSSKTTYVGPSNLSPYSDEMARINGPDGCARAGLIEGPVFRETYENSHTPVGIMISHLVKMLAWEYPDLRPLADYYSDSSTTGCGSGSLRGWPVEVYSDEIRTRVKAGLLSNGKRWDEWSVGFH